MKIYFLGTGTSTGIPQIGCRCPVCTSNDPKDNRLRSSVYIETDHVHMLIDAGPDLRQQLLNAEVNSIDAILITHEHYDHIGGLDDIRPMGHVMVYGETRALKTIKNNMPYSFAENKYPGVPLIELNAISTDKFKIKDIEILPVRIMHAQLPILGFRIGTMAYLTDVKTIDDENIEKLKNIDILVINALRHTSHISHLSLTESLELIDKIKPRMAYLTHVSHDMGLHKKTELTLPENVRLAYDNLVLNL
jgi:phosphoribosyl 1,2-cyclic phosphate phosphodiesterase